MAYRVFTGIGSWNQFFCLVKNGKMKQTPQREKATDMSAVAQKTEKKKKKKGSVNITPCICKILVFILLIIKF